MARRATIECITLCHLRKIKKGEKVVGVLLLVEVEKVQETKTSTGIEDEEDEEEK